MLSPQDQQLLIEARRNATELIASLEMRRAELKPGDDDTLAVAPMDEMLVAARRVLTAIDDSVNRLANHSKDSSNP